MDEGSTFDVETVTVQRIADCKDIWHVLFTPDGHLLAACSDGFVRKFSLSKKRLTQVQEFSISPGRDIQCLAMTANGRLWCGGRDGKILQIQPDDGMLTVIGEHSGWVTHLVVSPDEKTIASCGSDGVVKLWSLPTGQAIVSTIPPAGVSLRCLTFSADSQKILLGDSDGVIRIWDLVTQTFSCAPLLPSGNISGIQHLTDDSNVFIVSAGTQLHYHRLPPQQAIALPLPTSPKGRGFSDLGQLQIVDQETNPKLLLNFMNSILAYDLQQLDKLPVLLKPGHRSVTSLHNTPGGLIWVNTEKELLGIDSSGSIDERYPLPITMIVRTVHPLPGTGRFLLASLNTIAYWNSATPNSADYLVRIPDLSDRIQSVAVSPTGEEFCYSHGKMLHFRNMKDKQKMRPAIQLSDEVLTMHYSPDGQQLLLGLRNFVAEVWNVKDATRVSYLRHQGSVTCVAWTSSGETVITGCRDGTVRIWSPLNGMPLSPRLRHPFEVTSVAVQTLANELFTTSRTRTRSETQLFRWPLLPEPMTGTPEEISTRMKIR
jgi:WD40 repeat protein